MRILTILLTLFISCTTINYNVVTQEEYKSYYIDPNLNPIVEMFMYEARSRGRIVDLTYLSVTLENIRIHKRDLTIGYCVKDLIGGMTIKIHTPTWIAMNDYEREQLIFHELAHCLIGREHCSKIDNNGPISIMYPQGLDGQYYKTYREELVDELFNISPECIGDDGDSNEINGQVCSS